MRRKHRFGKKDKAKRSGNFILETQPERFVSLSFRYLQDYKDLQISDYKKVHNSLKIMTSLAWKHLTQHESLNYHPIPKSHFKAPLPATIPDNRAYVHSCKFSDKGRIIGFRDDDIFYIIRLDPDHSSY